MNDQTERELRRRRARAEGEGAADGKVVPLFAGAPVKSGAGVLNPSEETQTEASPKEKISLRRRILRAIFRAVDNDDW